MSRRPNPQTLRRLTYFAAIADAGSIREAARRLGLSVASVSEALAGLEDELGVTLATRNTRRLELTAEGRRVEQIAGRVLDAGDALFTDSIDPSEVTGEVALTAPVEIAQSWLPDQLDRFRREYPKVRVSISASDVLVDLAQSAFDLAIRALFRRPDAPVLDGCTLPLTCVSAKPLHLEPHGDGWITPTPLISHQTRKDLEVLDQKTGKMRRIHFSDVMVVDNKHVALAMVARGMGAALVTQASIDGWPELRECPSHMQFGQIVLETDMRDKRPSLAASGLRKVLSEEGVKVGS